MLAIIYPGIPAINNNIMMMKRLLPFLCCLFFWFNSYSQNNGKERQAWLHYMDRLARPVLSNLAANQLKDKMPVELSVRIDNPEQRKSYAYLEAFGRLLSGIGPWINQEGGSKEEVALRDQYRQWALTAIANAVNPAAKDYMQWKGGQPLVDASFFALGLIRCPWLWEHLDATVKENTKNALLLTRNTVPVYSNWILFSGMIEAFFCKYGYEYDKLRVEFGIREFGQHWYVGDGLFSDGMNFAMDNYNSYVIQPYLNAIMEVVNTDGRYRWFAPKLEQITRRYAVIQERLINTDGTFPVIGRSIAYRGGAFHHLADMALRKALPADVKPSQVRGALTAVIKKTSEAPSTFNKEGWLNIGLYGQQKDIADFYINTGSLYLCSAILLPLGLPDTDEFWAAPPSPWTSVKVWSGLDLPADHALDIH